MSEKEEAKADRATGVRCGGKDPLIVYGLCRWWDSIDKAGRVEGPRAGLPCCPHCASPLFQQTESEWWQGVDAYEADGHPGYRAQIEASRGVCPRSSAHASEPRKFA